MSDEIPIGPGNPRGEYGEHICKSFSQNQELKPCPFCGRKNIIEGGALSQETFSIWCLCGINIRHSHREILINRWNTRATDQMEKEHIRVIDVLKANTPNCPACAESLWCGSTNAKHTCAIEQLSLAQAKLAEMREVLKTIPSLEYWNYQFPSTVGNIPIKNMCFAVDNALSNCDKPSTHIPITALEPVVNFIQSTKLNTDSCAIVEFCDDVLTLLTKLKEQQ